MSDQHYYELTDDMLIPGRWVLNDPEGGTDWLDPSQFTDGQLVKIAIPLTIGLLQEGKTLDYSITTMGVPVVSERAADVLSSICGTQVQLIEVSAKDHPGPFFIANATRNAPCVDEQRSRGVELWTEKDGQPDRIGDYHAMDKLIIDPGRVGELDFFRVTRYTIALIVSERLKRAMEDAKLLGPKFVPVT